MPNEPWGVFPADEQPPHGVRTLAREVEDDGGAVLGIYREPVGGGWHIMALLPLAQVQATPYQRDLSPSHAKRLREVIKKLNRFVDPIVAVRHGPRAYWTPNGNHRRDALQKLKAQHIPVILIPDERVAFQILALNTEKAHNLKEKSLEVIRMVRALREAEPTSTEEDFAFQLEEAYFITLGLLYEQHPRFAGSVYAPVLRRVDRFLAQPLTKAYEARVRRAEAVERADVLLSQVAARLKRRGITHPYVKNFVMARVNPLARARKSVPTFDQTWERIEAGLERFDVEKIRPEDVTRAAAAPPSA